jgi:hypothetical protein
MKKLISASLAAVALASLSACSTGNKGGAASSSVGTNAAPQNVAPAAPVPGDRTLPTATPDLPESK